MGHFRPFSHSLHNKNGRRLQDSNSDRQSRRRARWPRRTRCKVIVGSSPYKLTFLGKQMAILSIDLFFTPFSRLSIFVQQLIKIDLTFLGSGCGSVGRAVASNTRGPQFESSHRQKNYLYIKHLFTVNCDWKDENKEKEAGNGPYFFKKNITIFTTNSCEKWWDSNLRPSEHKSLTHNH